MPPRRRLEDEGRALQQYMEEISRWEPLSSEAERELGRLIQDPSTSEPVRDDAVEQLVRHNLRFVVGYAKKFHSSEVSFLDLINEGNIGLMQAARRFDPDRGVRFITYAVWWVRQAMSHALIEQSGALRLPHKQAALQARIAKIKEELQQELGREPTVEDIAKAAGIGVQEANKLLSFNRNAESLSQSIGDEQDRTLEEVLEQTTVAAADEELLRRSSIEQIRALLKNLNKKERAVICRRFGIPEHGSDDETEPRTLQEIGEELAISRERVRQIEAQALQKIRRTMKLKTLGASLN
ncbi:MAG: RNA polymerase sigma factor RpoD/SigA [Thermoanaerobaculia bacterium]|nr:RNA polymerase sigma factor RpoD/SigA [Thermoanaerobaculia bacterium]